MNWKKDEDGALVLDENGDPIALSESGEVIPLDKVVSLGKHARVESERDELKAQVDKLAADIEALNASAGDAEKLKAEVERITAESETAKTEWEGKLASREKEFAIESELLRAGCRDTKAARAHIDADALELKDGNLSGLDLESFKKDRAYLFDKPKKVDTGLPPSGTESPDDGLRSAMGLPADKE